MPYPDFSDFPGTALHYPHVGNTDGRVHDQGRVPFPDCLHHGRSVDPYWTPHRLQGLGGLGAADKQAVAELKAEYRRVVAMPPETIDAGSRQTLLEDLERQLAAYGARPPLKLPGIALAVVVVVGAIGLFGGLRLLKRK